MKLLKCHVDNFGKLSNYDYEFTGGLNTIQEPNGFGKSTLAAFIKAMFYGFTNDRKQSIIENERKKYSPWQGGSYGGYLEFEFEGINYRVKRTFGEKASKDTFSLLDILNHKESLGFSEKLGEELFQLDSKSFMRSVYMSQVRDTDIVSTTSIQTKLSNLVDNTDDMNNYDSAMSSLKDARMAYQKFRGLGGIIDDMQNKISSLESKLIDAEAKIIPLKEITKEFENLNEQKEQQEKEISLIRDKITKASKQQGDNALREQFVDLEKKLQTTEDSIEKLNKLYPEGCPKKEEVTINNKRVLEFDQAERGLSELEIREEDIKCEAEWREVFADVTETSNDIRLCQTKYDNLSEVTAQTSIQMSKEELMQLDVLEETFEHGVPTEQEIRDYQAKIDLLSAKKGELKANQLSAQEIEQLYDLERFFGENIVDENELEYCEDIQGQIKTLENKLQDMILSDKEKKEWNRLSHIFSIEVPEDSVILQRQNDCRRIDELNSKKNTKTIVLQSNQESGSKNSKASVGLIILGAVLILAGLFGFVSNSIATGAVCTVFGFVVILISFWMHTKQMVNQSSGQATVESSAISEEEIQELYNLQKNLKEFIFKFYDNNSDINTNLTDLMLDKKAYLQLKEKKEDIESKVNELRDKIAENQKILQNIFSQYYPNSDYQERFVSEVRDKWRNYKSLRERHSNLQEIRDRLENDIENLIQELKTEFAKYYQIDDNKEFSDILSQLKSDVQTFDTLKQKYNRTKSIREEAENKKSELSESIEYILKKYNTYSENDNYNDSIENLRNNFYAYQNAVKNVVAFKKRKEELERQKSKAKEGLEHFAKEYGIDIPVSEEVLSKISDDIINYEKQIQENVELLKKLEDFKSQHPEYKDVLSKEEGESEELPSTEVLIEEEKYAKEKLRVTDEELQIARNKRKDLLNKVEQIPDMEDQLNRLKTEKKNAENSRDILDNTLRLLETAKNNLSNQYVGGVEQNFTNYIQKLLGNGFDNTIIGHDLKIHVDEKGEAREIGYFSAGTVDCMLICMRLALIDSLFKQEKPFIILDDPFVNLDDAHTSYALEMLKKIARDKQIIYMVCNSSRT